MLELGAHAARLHASAGARPPRAGLDLLIAVGGAAGAGAGRRQRVAAGHAAAQSAWLHVATATRRQRRRCKRVRPGRPRARQGLARHRHWTLVVERLKAEFA